MFSEDLSNLAITYLTSSERNERISNNFLKACAEERQDPQFVLRVTSEDLQKRNIWPVSLEAWNHRKDDSESHPCDDGNIGQCMCKGSCSCHWQSMGEQMAEEASRVWDLAWSELTEELSRFHQENYSSPEDLWKAGQSLRSKLGKVVALKPLQQTLIIWKIKRELLYPTRMFIGSDFLKGKF